MTKQVDINAYAAEQIKNGSPVMSFIKTARIQARPGKIGNKLPPFWQTERLKPKMSPKKEI